MAENIVQSLFGFTPEAVQQQMYQAGENRAMQLAQMSRSPTAASEFYGLRAAERFGAAPIFGPAPQVQKASNLQNIVQGVVANGADLSTPEGMLQLADVLNRNPEFNGIATGLRQEASKMSQAQTKFAYDIGAKAASIQKDIAQAGQAEAGRASDRMNTRFVDLATRERTTGLSAPEKAEYESIKELMTIKSPKGQTIDLAGAFDKAFTAADAKEKAQEWAKAGASYTSAIPILNQIDKVESIVPNAFTGKFAEGKLGLSKALGAFGIPISDKASDTEYINAISAKLVQQIARAFPGSLAVKELDQLVKSKPNIAQESGTILRLLGEIRDEIQAQTTTYEQLSKIDKTKRYDQDPNVLQGQNYNKIRRYRDIKTRALAGTATKDEALEAQRIQQELGLK